MKSFFSTLITLPVVIRENGVYQTRAGELVTIFRVSKAHDFECRGTYWGGIRDGWHKSGRLFFHDKSDNDIVKKADLT